MKKLLLSLLFTGVLFAQTTTLTLTSTQTAVRSAAAVTSQLTLSNNTTVSALQFTVTNPVDVSALSVSIGLSATAANKTLACGTVTSNTVTCIIYGINTTVIGNGVVATIQGNVVNQPTVNSGLAGMETVAISNIIAVNGTGTAVTTNTTSSENLSVLSNCDLNSDGLVNASDVATELSWVLGTVAVPTGFSANLNGVTGTANVLDVALEINADLNQSCPAVTF